MRIRRTYQIASALGLLAVAACSCEETSVTQLFPQLEVPEVLDLGQVPVGVRAQGVFTLRSKGTAVLEVPSMALRGDPVFVLTSSPSLTLAPGDTAPVIVAARSSTIGAFESVLEVTSNDPDRAVAAVRVLLQVVHPPPCEDGNVCTEDWFDVALPGCRHRFTDGTTCQPADRCVVEAVCSQGVCLGTSKVCTDESPCTRDVCRQIDGECRFVQDATLCDDHNSCTVDACGPNGCAHEALLNGTPCDDRDPCTTGDTCFGGDCVGSSTPEGSTCDDEDSCTKSDTCQSGRCQGHSILSDHQEGEVIFSVPLIPWGQAFLHRREVSLTDDGTVIGLDHLPLLDLGLTHLVFTTKQCGTSGFEFSYRPPDTHVFVSYVRREMQLRPDNRLRLVVGIRQTREQGFLPQTTTYVLDKEGRVLQSRIQELGGETGRALLPDDSHVYAVVWPSVSTPIPPGDEAFQNLVVVREDRDGSVLWRHERTSGVWAEFLGVAGPRILYWANESWGALDFNTGQVVWQSPTPYISDQMALSTSLNLGLARVGVMSTFGVAIPTQVVGVEILEGRQVFVFPPVEDPNDIPRTDPVIAADGRIILLMQRSALDHPDDMLRGLDYVELAPDGTLLKRVELPYVFPAEGWLATRSRDFGDDSYPTVADDGVTYVGYGDRFWAIDPGGRIRWTLTSTMPDAFTATVPLLRDDGVMLISEGSRKLLGVRTNGGKMSAEGWASFRHDNRRTNYTP